MKKKKLLFFLILIPFYYQCSKKPHAFTLMTAQNPCVIMLDLGSYKSAGRANADYDNVDWHKNSESDAVRRALCALELRNYLARRVGVPRSKIPIFDDHEPVPKRNVLFIGVPPENDFFSSMRRTVQKRWQSHKNASNQSFRLDSFNTEEKNVLVLSGKTSIGELYAGYELLMQLGVRWFIPGVKGEYVPLSDSLSVPGYRRFYDPQFQIRGFWMDHSKSLVHDSLFIQWMGRNRLNFYAQHKNANKDMKRRGFMLNTGERHVVTSFVKTRSDESATSTRGFCVSDAEELEQFNAFVLQKITGGAWNGTDVIDVWAPQKWCDCPECKASGNAADKLFTVMESLKQAISNAVDSDRLNRNYQVHGYLHHSGVRVPQNVYRFDNHSDITIFLHTGERCFNHYIIDPKCADINYHFAEHLLDWLEKDSPFNGPVGIAENYNADFMRGVPAIFPSIMKIDIPAFAEMGVRGIHYQNPRVQNPGVSGLVNYQFAKQIWFPNVSVDSIQREYFLHQYGPVATTMKKYYTNMEKATRNITTWSYYLPQKLDSLLAFISFKKDKEYWQVNERFAQIDTVTENSFNADWEQSYHAIYEARYLLSKAMEKELPARINERLAVHARDLVYTDLVMNLYDSLISFLTLGKNEPEMREEALLRLQEYASRLKDKPSQFPGRTQAEIAGIKRDVNKVLTFYKENY